MNKIIFYITLLLSILMYTPVYGETVTIKWTKSPSSDVANYRVYQSNTSKVYTSANRIAQVSKTTYSYTIKNILNTTDIFWIVTAVDAKGNESVACPEVSTQWYNQFFKLFGTTMPPNMTYWYNN